METIDLKKKYISRQISYYIVFIIAIIFFSLFIYKAFNHFHNNSYFVLSDNAMNTLHYAKNIINGNGLIFSLGTDFSRGPGYGSFLQVILFIIPQILKTYAPLGIMIISLLTLLLNLWTIKLIAGHISKQSFFVTIMALTLCALHVPLAITTMNGTEAGLLSLLINFSVLMLFYLEDEWKDYQFFLLLVAISLGILTRVEMIFLFFLIIIFGYKKININFHKKWLIGTILSIIISIIVLYFTRYVIHKTILLNETILLFKKEIILKTIFFELKNLIRYIYSDLYPYLIFSLGIFLIKGDHFNLSKRSKKKFHRNIFFDRIWFLLSLVSVACILSLFFPNKKISTMTFSIHITAIIPLIIIVSTLGLNQLRRSAVLAFKETYKRRLILIIFFLLIWPPFEAKKLFHIFQSSYMKQERNDAKRGIIINKATSNNILIAVHHGGNLSYYSSRNTLDLSGLNNPDNYYYKLKSMGPLLLKAEISLVTQLHHFSKKHFREMYTNGYNRNSNGFFFHQKISKGKIKSGFWGIRFLKQ